MADESMVRNLEAQARAIWPQEEPLFARYALPAQPRILDAGCGTGVSFRMADLFRKPRGVAGEVPAPIVQSASPTGIESVQAT